MRCANAAAISMPGTFSFRNCASLSSRYLRIRTLCGKRPRPVKPGGMRLIKNDRDPKLLIRDRIRALSPSIMAATQITLVTPMMIPRIVNAERTLRERSVSIATARFSLSSPAVNSLRPQRHHRVELGRFHRRINTEKQTDDRAEHHAQ